MPSRLLAGQQQVLKYLARYTHRVAISNGRLLELNDGRITFSYKDYAASSEIKTMTLEMQEFARRFLLHVLPRGFVRIRYYGFLANCRRAEKLELCRRLLSTQRPDAESITEIPKDDQQIDPPAAHPNLPELLPGEDDHHREDFCREMSGYELGVSCPDSEYLLSRIKDGGRSIADLTRSR